MSLWARMTMEEVLERTGMNEEMLDRAIRLGYLPAPENGGWSREVIEGFMESLGTRRDYIFDDE